MKVNLPAPGESLLIGSGAEKASQAELCLDSPSSTTLGLAVMFRYIAVIGLY